MRKIGLGISLSNDEEKRSKRKVQLWKKDIKKVGVGRRRQDRKKLKKLAKNVWAITMKLYHWMNITKDGD